MFYFAHERRRETSKDLINSHFFNQVLILMSAQLYTEVWCNIRRD